MGDVLEKSFKEMSVIEKKHKKGVTWKDREPGNQTEKKEGNEEGKQSDTTYVMEDPNYKAALKIVNHALETLLNMKISIANMNYMENVVKIIISLCLDYNINTGDIQENMLAMGNYIREFQRTSRGAEGIRADNERLSKEIEHLNIQLDSFRNLYEGYRRFTTNNVTGSQVEGSVLVERMLELEKEIEDLKNKNEKMEIKYSHAYGRKEDYKTKYLDLEKR